MAARRHQGRATSDHRLDRIPEGLQRWRRGDQQVVERRVAARARPGARARRPRPGTSNGPAARGPRSAASTRPTLGQPEVKRRQEGLALLRRAAFRTSSETGACALKPGRTRSATVMGCTDQYVRTSRGEAPAGRSGRRPRRSPSTVRPRGPARGRTRPRRERQERRSACARPQARPCERAQDHGAPPPGRPSPTCRTTPRALRGQDDGQRERRPRRCAPRPAHAAATNVQGSQAAPAKWCHRIVKETKGPAGRPQHRADDGGEAAALQTARGEVDARRGQHEVSEHEQRVVPPRAASAG